jgi:hypothetical protein
MDYRERFLSCLMGAVLLFSTASLKTALAQTAPPMGTAQSFAVLASSTVTNTGATLLTGDLGVSPGSAITGFPPGSVTGTIYAADSIAAQARLDAGAAFTHLAGEPCTADLSGSDLGGLTLTPGVYCFSSSAQLTGTLTLNATGNPNAVFVFQMGSTFTVAGNSTVVVNGGSACNVYFQVGSSATLGTGAHLLGSIFAGASITMNTGATVTGGSYALGGAVTLDGNTATACMGTLQVCKAAGSGVAEGTPFTFDVAGSRVVVLAGPSPAGTCGLALTMPAGPATITEVLPPGTALAEVSTLPGPGLLISSNLGAGTATVAVNAGGLTIATFLNTAPPAPTTGFLQICKVAGSGISVAPPANFAFSVNGTPIPGGTVPAGPAPSGSCSVPLEVPAGETPIAETLPSGTLLTDVRTLPNAGLLVSSNLALGTATVTVNAGGQTIATFTNAAAVPTTGFLQICKVAGSGVVAGANFGFSVDGTPIPGGVVPAGPAPSGSCGLAMELPVGEKIIAETRPISDILSVLTVVSASPSGSLVGSDLGARTARLTVSPGGLTIATFTNAVVAPPTGFLQICKVAGNVGVEGTIFGFSIAGTPPTAITVAAGPAPLGSCSTPLEVPAGSVFITETPPTAGTLLTAVSTLPAGLLVSSDLGARTATVTVNPGGQTIATFLNTQISTTGFLQICKIAGAGVSQATPFRFSVAGIPAPVDVVAGPAPGGNCSPALEVPVGPTSIAESEIPPATGSVLTSVSTLPSGLLVSSNLAARTATVTVNAGGQTIVTFLNTRIPVTPGAGFLQICKIAGAGIALETGFRFSVAGIPTPVEVAAGPAPGGSCSTPLEVPAGEALITEAASPDAVLASVSTLPSVGLLIGSDLAAGTATVTVNAGGQTIVTFVNASSVGRITLGGQVRICKTAGTGVAPAGKFNFVVDGTSYAVLAGGPCVTVPTLFDAGTAVTVTEAPSSGTRLEAVRVNPADRQLGSADLVGRTVSVTIGTDVTEVNFTNIAGGLGLLKVCKAAGTGVATGENFTFVAAGATFSVPAGYCVNRGMLPVGTAVTITEVISPATVASAISVLPGGPARFRRCPRAVGNRDHRHGGNGSALYKCQEALVHCVANSDHSVEDAADGMPARTPARPAESPRHECVFLAVVSPRRDGCAGCG